MPCHFFSAAVLPDPNTNIYRTTMWLGSVVLLLLAAHPAARGLAVNSPDKAAPDACPTLEMDLAEATTCRP